MVHIDWHVSESDWARALAQCPDATFFHTDAWLQVAMAAFQVQPVRARLEWPDGRWALLPLTVRTLARGLLPVATAGEAGAYGGLVAPAPLTADAEVAGYAAVRRRYPDLCVTGNPFAAPPMGPDAVPGGRAEPQRTHVLDLRPLAELRAGFSRGCKARCNKARKLGLKLRVSTCPADAALFYALYQDSVRRWGDKLTWERPLAFYEGLMREGGPAVRLFLAEHDGRVIAGLLFATYGTLTHYVAGATLGAALEACPSNFLMEEALSAYASEGLTRFDFGPSNGLEGVERFKESFGARPLAFDAQRATSMAGRLYLAVKAPMARLWGTPGRRPQAHPASAPHPAPAGV